MLDTDNGVVTPRIAVVIVNYRTPELTLKCVEALESERDDLPSLSVIVVDGGSGDGSAEYFNKVFSGARFSEWVKVLCLEINGGFGWANNQALLRLLKCQDCPEFIYLLNPDTIVQKSAVHALSRRLQACPDAAAAGSQLSDLNGDYAASAFNFPTIPAEFVRGTGTAAIGRALGVKSVALPTSKIAFEVDWVTGASVMFRADALRDAGLFDDGFFLYHEEVELMWRLRRAGWAIWHEPASVVMHIGGAATGINSPKKTSQPARLPPYWYKSRARYFALTKGRIGAILAVLSWLCGRLFWGGRLIVQKNLISRGRVSETWDYLRYCLGSVFCGFRPSVPDWSSEPGATPAWMRRGR